MFCFNDLSMFGFDDLSIFGVGDMPMFGVGDMFGVGFGDMFGVGDIVLKKRRISRPRFLPYVIRPTNRMSH